MFPLTCLHRTPLKMLCESMKRQIVSRAFYGCKWSFLYLPLWYPYTYLTTTWCLFWKAVWTQVYCCESDHLRTVGWMWLKGHSFIILLFVGFACSSGRPDAYWRQDVILHCSVMLYLDFSSLCKIYLIFGSIAVLHSYTVQCKFSSHRNIGGSFEMPQLHLQKGAADIS